MFLESLVARCWQLAIDVRHASKEASLWSKEEKSIEIDCHHAIYKKIGRPAI
jgi:hypothetical protein